MKISAIIPAYNASKFLERAVQSLIDTCYPHLEIVIVEDGSNDTTWVVAQQLQQRYPEIVASFHHPNRANRGVSASRNLGIRQSTGKLICFLDADDYVFPHRFKTAVPLLLNEKTTDGVYELTCMVFEGEPDKQRFWDESNLFGINRKIEADFILKTLLKGTTWATSAILFRRSILEKTGLFHEDLCVAEDCHLWFRMASVGRIVAGNMKDPVSVYYRHKKNSYKQGIERKIDMIKAMADTYRWSRRRKISAYMMSEFLEGIRNYILNSIIIARESSRPDVAWNIIYSSIIWGGPSLLTNLKIIHQIGALARGNILKRRLNANV